MAAIAAVPGEVEREVIRQIGAAKSAAAGNSVGGKTVAAGIGQEGARQLTTVKAATGAKIAGAAGLEKEAMREMLAAKVTMVVEPIME